MAEGTDLFVQAEKVIAGNGDTSVILQKKQAWILYGESNCSEARKAYESISVEE